MTKQYVQAKVHELSWFCPRCHDINFTSGELFDDEHKKVECAVCGHKSEIEFPGLTQCS